MPTKTDTSKTISGYIFALVTVALWSGNFIVARGLNQTVPPITIACCRWSVAIIAFLPFGLKPLITEWKIIKRNLPYLAITAFLGISVFNTLIYFASHSTTATNLSLIATTFPVFVIIISRFVFNELITKNKIAGITIVLSGVLLLISQGSISRILNISFAIGDLWMLLGAFSFAFYTTLIKKKPADLSIGSLQLSTFILGLCFLFPLLIWETTTNPPVVMAKNIILSLLYIGICSSFIAFVLWNKAISIIGPTKAVMIYYALPLFCGILASFFLKEKITQLHLYSLILILSGILIANTR